MTKTIASLGAEKSWVFRWGSVAAVLVISLLATILLWRYEEHRVMEDGQMRFDHSSQLLKDDIANTLKAYAQFLRGSVSFVQASQGVSRDRWRQYVTEARLSENYPGIQGVGLNGFLKGEAELEAFLTRVRQSDWPDYSIRPSGVRDTYAPVLFVEPLTERNKRAIGFDIYSEDVRRATVDKAVLSGEPVMTARITLVQEDDPADDGVVQGDVQAGVLLILPTYGEGTRPVSASDRRDAASGLLVSVFRIGDLINYVFKSNGQTPQKRIRLQLFDGDSAGPETQLYGDAFDQDVERHTALFSNSNSLNLYGRVWSYEMESTQEFENEVYSASPKFVLAAGTLVSLLLTSLVLGQSQRVRDTELTAEKLALSQRRIEMLMAEVNHRSKNLLSLVQAIARQTRSDDPRQFVSQFSERIQALAASQDLLVKHSWKGISLHDLVDSQLAHFKGLLGDRIRLSGPDLDVSAEAAQSLGMAIHELATNAGKYGALSNSVGVVDIDWRLDTGALGEGRLEISWLESGGPIVVTPTHKGFGTKVTEMMVKYSLNGQVSSSFNKTGFTWHLSCPTDRVFEDPTDPIGVFEKERGTAV
jgi:two-component sensor histidine kinase